MSIQIRITVSKEINSLLERVSKKLGKKKSMLARELMEQKMYDLELIQKELQEMREYVASRGKLIVDCRELVRMDFVAAGELLNETVTFRASGKDIVFLDVSSIVAALMSVMGIHELADIRKRRF